MVFYRANKNKIALLLLLFMLISISSMFGMRIYLTNNSTQTQNQLSQSDFGFYLLSFSLYSLAIEGGEGSNPINYKFQRRYSPFLRQNAQGALSNSNLQSLGRSGMSYCFARPLVLEISDATSRIICYIHEKDGKKDLYFF